MTPRGTESRREFLKIEPPYRRWGGGEGNEMEVGGDNALFLVWKKKNNFEKLEKIQQIFVLYD